MAQLLAFQRFVEVGTPVARRPPHRSRRAVFPHRALQINSLSHGSDRIVHGVAIPPVADKNSVRSDKARHAVPQCAVAAPGTVSASDGALTRLNSVSDSAGSAICTGPGRS